jgi:hypothetical protein
VIERVGGDGSGALQAGGRRFDPGHVRQTSSCKHNHFLPNVGVLKVKRDAFCPDYLRFVKVRDRMIAKARPVIVPILRKRPPQTA